MAHAGGCVCLICIPVVVFVFMGMKLLKAELYFMYLHLQAKWA